jgi:signal peptidase I
VAVRADERDVTVTRPDNDRFDGYRSRTMLPRTDSHDADSLSGEGIDDAIERLRTAKSVKPPPSSARNIAEWVAVIVGAIVVAIIIRQTTVATYKIPSGSMEPTLHGCPGCTGDRVIVNKWSYRLHDINRGDVVVFSRPPAETDTAIKDLIKRVIGLPGETVEGKNSQVYVNGQPLIEPYVNPACGGTQDFAPRVVPAGDIFVMGDNRCNSSDSRVFGPVDQDLVVGRAMARIYPFGHLGWL